MGYKDIYNEWLESDIIDEATKEELRGISGDEKEIEERFYTQLSFGTAGLRGIIGAGTNRMNAYTVRKATQGLANYILKVGGQERGVAIAYDSRHMSPEFADEAACCLAANGIKAYVFESLRPTPELSFAVRHTNSIAGINITASHNPSNYNGYKVYWEDGAQITPPHDTGIMDEVKAIDDYAKCKTMPLSEAKSAGLYIVMGADVDDVYMKELKALVLHQDLIDKHADEIKIVYSPLHGTGNIPVRRILKDLGFNHVEVVPEQEMPDGDFPSVSYPNPESKEAFELGLKMAEKNQADLVLATDPDADRLGVYVRDSKGDYHSLTGNMSGCLIGEYIISQKLERDGKLPEDGAFIRSIVTTHLADAIAKNYGAELIEVLTGFKYIGGKMLEFENTGKGTYLFGMEESYGCLPGTYARDKDAVAATMFLCEAACYYKSLGKNLWDAMVDIYEKYGYYKDDVVAITLAGKEGIEKIGKIMSDLRGNVPEQIAGSKVEVVKDFDKDEVIDIASGAKKPTGLPNSNVLLYELEGDAWVCVRPSGTEPKIKFYFGIKGSDAADADAKETKMKDGIQKMIDKMI